MLEEPSAAANDGEISPQVSSWYAFVTPGREWANVAVVIGCCLLLAAVTIPFILQARQDAHRIQSKNNLKQLGLAFHNYHDVYAQFPLGADIRPDGTAIQGWIIRLIPYLESSSLYSQINPHFAWDHPANSLLFKFAHPALLNPCLENTVTVDGFGLTHYQANPSVFHRNSGVRISDMTSGSTHSWLAGETSDSLQPFAYPFNWRELSLPFKGNEDSYGSFDDRTQFCLADGSVVSLSEDIDQSVIKALAQAPPVASDASKATAHRVFQCTSKSKWRTDYLAAMGEDQTIKQTKPVGTTLHFDLDGQLDTADLYSTPNDQPVYAEDGTARIDLFGILERNPEVRVLLLNSTPFNDKAAVAISACPRLETIVVSQITLSDAGRDSLRQSKTLKSIVTTSGLQFSSANLLHNTGPDSSVDQF